MSCCDSQCGSGSADPCSIGNVSQESISSKLDNLIFTLFGELVKTVVNGRAVWTAPCSSETAQLTCYPRLSDEGFICYLLRLIAEVALVGMEPHDSTHTYCGRTLVSSGSSFYVSLQDVPAGILISNAAYWQLVLTAPAGPPGPQGDPGTPGAGSAINYSTRTTAVDTSLSDTDAVLFCEPAAPITITIPDMATLLLGKWFVIETDGADAVTIQPSGGDTINGAASYVLDTPNEAVFLVSKNSGNWYIA